METPDLILNLNPKALIGQQYVDINAIRTLPKQTALTIIIQTILLNAFPDFQGAYVASFPEDNSPLIRLEISTPGYSTVYLWFNEETLDIDFYGYNLKLVLENKVFQVIDPKPEQWDFDPFS